jgi:hypothetical protein
MNLPKACIVAFVITLTGCDSSQPQSTTAPSTPYCQRFVPIPADGFFTQGVYWHGYFALDTKTGELCTTVSNAVLPKGAADDMAHQILSCSLILQAEKEAAKH